MKKKMEKKNGGEGEEGVKTRGAQRDAGEKCNAGRARGPG